MKKKAKKVSIKKKVITKKAQPQPGLNDALEQASVKIKIFGVGGAGCSIISEIAKIITPSRKISFCAVNTDVQSFSGLHDSVKTLPIGKELTQGLGCGMNDQMGKLAAEESVDSIKKQIDSADFCIFISGLGGGTGSGAMPIMAETAKELKKLSLGIFTFPFKFEGDKRKKMANDAFDKIKPNLCANLLIPNDKVFSIIDVKTAIKESFSLINKDLAQSINGLLETLFMPGLINIDFADIRTILDGYGRYAYQNTIIGERKNIGTIIEKLLNNPLSNHTIIAASNTKLIHADRILFNITGPTDLKMAEVDAIAQQISSANPKAKIIFGVNLKPDKGGKIRITVLAIGDEAPFFKKAAVTPAPKQEEEPQKSEEKKKIVKKKTPVKQKRKLVKKKKANKPKKIVKKPVGLSRKNALDIKKEQEIAVKQQSDEDNKWDIPAFLRMKK